MVGKTTIPTRPGRRELGAASFDELDVDPAEVEDAIAALRQRITAASAAISGPGLSESEATGATLTELLDRVVAQLIETRRSEYAWLLFVTVSTVMPTMSEVEAVVRQARWSGVAETRIWLLGFALKAARTRGQLRRRMRIVNDSTLVDVNFSATDEHNTGIQRVVRRTVPEWIRAGKSIELAAWGGGGYRTLTERERHRVLAWDDGREGDHDSSPVQLVVPWKSRVILSEVPSRAFMCDPIAAVARYSGSRVSLIGYDAIPVVSAEAVPVDMSDHFAKFLAVVKWADSVAAISGAAAGEFRGFVDMLGSQGLVGPRVVECLLPSDAVRPVVVSGRDRPLVAVVGSKEPRKNHVAVLFAAERLWREGLDFELLFVGTYGWDTRLFRRWLKRLRKVGRPVSAPARVGDDGLWRAYAEARFTVFPSLHEGYGLPVAESLSYGTPVITTVYGSTGEIAAGGGCVTVDPRDDEQIVDAMRLLLTDDVVLERLRGEARSREVKSWEQYAAEVWSVVAGGR